EEMNVEAQLNKIRSGWTLECVGNITIGELYLMFGQNKKLTLEYEFEDPNSRNEEACIKSPRTPSFNSFESPKRLTKNSNEQGLENTIDLAQGLEKSNEAITLVDKPYDPTNEEGNVRGTNADQGKDNSAIEKKEAVENLSGMLQQLLGMARTIFSNPGGVYDQPCPCGHVCAPGGGIIPGLRSPAASRCQNVLGGVGRSPCSTRSPRNSRFGVDGFLSPKASLSDNRGRSPLLPKQKRETRKPASAKKLIPDLPDIQSQQTRERLTSVSGSDIFTDLIDGSFRNQISIEDGQHILVNSQNPQVSIMNFDGSIGSMTTTSSSIDNKLVNTTSLDALPGSRVGNPGNMLPGQMSSMISQTPTILGKSASGSGQAPAVIGTTPVSIAGMSIVVGSDAGEFRIPTAPAPRQVQSQASFNAQLNKLLPRWTKRSGRSVMRNKNVVIQRQLQLLPKMPPRPPSLVTLNVLPQATGQATSANPGGTFMHRMPLASSAPKNVMNIRQLVPGMQMVQQTHTGQNVRHIAPTVQVAGPVAHTVQATGPAVEQQPPIIVPNITSQQNTIVSGQPTGTSIVVSSSQANLSSGNAISINVSGQPMLTVPMPTANNSILSNLVPDASAAVIPNSGAAHMVNNNTVNNIEKTTSVSDQQHLDSGSSMNVIFKDIVSEALSELPDLSTPPGTPRPAAPSSFSTPMNTPNPKAAGPPPGSHHDLTIISPSSLFNTSFTLDSGTPSLYGNLPDTETAIATSLADDAPTSLNQLTSSPAHLLSVSNTRYLSELSPPHA
ncbi:unnamed protein product, partial [Meganyctiphanes norvegica]